MRISDWSSDVCSSDLASYESSSILARQIEQGAPADLYISANEKWMDYLAERKLIDPATRVDLLGNTLVLIGPKGVAPVDIAPGFDLVARLGGGRLAMGDPDHVPAGIYGRSALEHLGVWARSEEHTSELQSLMRISYAVVCLQKKER